MRASDHEESRVGVRKGSWSEEEDNLLRDCVGTFGEGKWHLIPQRAGLNRCRKSCRLRWLNYLKPGIKRGHFAADETDLIIRMHKLLGNKWSLIAGRIPGRTANDVKNYWNTHIRKKDMSSSCKKQEQEQEKEQEQEQEQEHQQHITKINIIRPRPQTFSKTTTRTTPLQNDTVPFPNAAEAAVRQASDDEINNTWWETLLNDDDVEVVDRSMISWNTINIMINHWKYNELLLGEDGDTSITSPTGVDQNLVLSWPPF